MGFPGSAPPGPHPCPAHNGGSCSVRCVVGSSVSLMGPALITMRQSLSPVLLPALCSCASPLPVASYLFILQPSNKFCLSQSPGLLPSAWSPPSSPCVALHRCLLSQGRGLSWSLRPGTGTCVHSVQKLDVVSAILFALLLWRPECSQSVGLWSSWVPKWERWQLETDSSCLLKNM